MLAVGFRNQFGDLARAIHIARLHVAAGKACERLDVFLLLVEHGGIHLGGSREVAIVGRVLGGGQQFGNTGPGFAAGAASQLADEGADLALGQGAHEGVNRLAIAERHHGRDRLRARHLGDLREHARVLVDVDLHHLHGAVVLADDLLEHGPERAARAAPRGPEIHDDGDGLRRLDDVGHEGLVGAVRNVGAFRAATRGFASTCADDVHGTRSCRSVQFASRPRWASDPETATSCRPAS